jgi:uncharacterized protein (UPF0218 family)
MKRLPRETLLLPDELRPRLRKPLGRLFPGVRELLRAAEKTRGRLVTVGDRVTFEMISMGLRPDVAVVDLREKRKPVKLEIREKLKGKIVRVKNPAGSLTPELFSALASAEDGTLIIVDGEEDLAALPAILLSPDGSAVVYGQPGEGAVLVRVSERKRREVWEIIKSFKGEAQLNRNGGENEA